MNCPNCKTECERDSVDNGVCMQFGPYGCPNCGWSECEEYDLNKIKQPENGIIDQYGGYKRK